MMYEMYEVLGGFLSQVSLIDDTGVFFWSILGDETLSLSLYCFTQPPMETMTINQFD